MEGGAVRRNLPERKRVAMADQMASHLDLATLDGQSGKRTNSWVNCEVVAAQPTRAESTHEQSVSRVLLLTSSQIVLCPFDVLTVQGKKKGPRPLVLTGFFGL
jgi:hypothetical protein